MIFGTVLKGVGGLYTVLLDEEYEGKRTVTLRGRGSFRHEKQVLLTGDRVEIEAQKDGSFFCKSILERKNSLIRPPLANLDIIFVVIPCKKPMPSYEIIDKMIAIAEHNHIEPVIVITKSDLDEDFAKEAYSIYKNSGFNTFITSSAQKSGTEEILDYLKSVTKEQNPICAFAGASGAGKTTLLQILGTLSTPDSGSLVIDGVDVLRLKGDKLAEFRNQKIGFVFQFHHLLPEFTALENVMIPAFIAGRSKKEAEQAAIALLRDLGLGERLNHKPSELSGGEQQRVAIARALINNPSVLFADEPSGNLDTKTKEELHNLFFQLREKYGQTIVIVTHDPDLAKMCDRELFMVDGQFV